MSKPAVSAVRAILASLVFAPLTAITIVVLTILAPLDRRRKWIDPICRWWGGAIFYMAGVQTQGTTPALKDPYIVMANHQSYLDPPLLIWKLPLSLRFVAKAELKFIPFLGWGMWLMGHIFIDRKDREKAVVSLKKAACRVKAGATVLVFPEGTRATEPGAPLLPFKKGGFMLAIESGVPILPIGIAGTLSCLPKGSWRVRPGRVSYEVGEPISTQGFNIQDRDRLMEEVRHSIENLRRRAEETLL